MKSFFEEYGKIIVTAVVVISLIAVTVALRPVVQNNLNSLVGDMSNGMGNITISEVNVGGGSGSFGGNGSSSVNMANINVTDGTATLAAGDFSTKGNLVTINDTQYRVLEVNGTQVKVMSMDGSISSKFNETGVTTAFGSKIGQKYGGSTLDTEMTNYYNSLPADIQNAIVEQDINQSMYIPNTVDPGNADFLSTEPGGYNHFLTKKTSINVGSRNVYALDVDEAIAYLGPNSTSQDIIEMFWASRSSVGYRYVWLRSAYSGDGNDAFGVIGSYGYFGNYDCDRNYEARPVFVIDLVLLS